MPETASKTPKYLIACPIPEPQVRVVERHMNIFATGIGRTPLYQSLEPHLSLHPPVTTVPVEKLKEVVRRLAYDTKPITVTTGSLQLFGSELLVLPIQGVKLGLARVWTHLHDEIFRFSQEKGQFDEENTLHVTLADDLSCLDEDMRKSLTDLIVHPISFTVDQVVLYERLYEGSNKWEKLDMLPFSG